MSEVAEFVDHDWASTLFPLKMQAAFIKVGEAHIRAFLKSHVFDRDIADGFQKATVDYVLKDEIHKRRVMILDPLATFFLYDLVWRNRKSLTTPRTGNRRFYGYGFDSDKKRIDGFRDYHAFRRARYKLKDGHKCQLRADVFNCFNSFYHHRLASDFRARVQDPSDGDHLGQFLREINAGDSIWCFPQGLYPAKVIGNQYLRFVEESRRISAKHIVRFLDDIYLFEDSKAAARRDLLNLQEVLGSNYLALNELKTEISTTNETYGEERIDEIKAELLHKREELGGGYSEDEEKEDEDSEDVLNEAQKGYLIELLGQSEVATEDIELGLVLLRDSPSAFEILIPHVTQKAPHLLRELHRAAAGFGFDNDAAELLWAEITGRLKHIDRLTSHELFWYVRLLVDRIALDESVAETLLRIAKSEYATPVVRAAILELDTLKYGFAELKEKTLDEAPMGLTTHAVLYGLRNMEKSRRNQSFKYVGRAGSHWQLMTTIASRF